MRPRGAQPFSVHHRRVLPVLEKAPHVEDPTKANRAGTAVVRKRRGSLVRRREPHRVRTRPCLIFFVPVPLFRQQHQQVGRRERRTKDLWQALPHWRSYSTTPTSLVSQLAGQEQEKLVNTALLLLVCTRVGCVRSPTPTCARGAPASPPLQRLQALLNIVVVGIPEEAGHLLCLMCAFQHFYRSPELLDLPSVLALIFCSCPSRRTPDLECDSAVV